MSLFKLSLWGIRDVITDIQNYRDWIKTVKKEKNNPKSNFVKWKIENNLFYTIYFTHNIDESEEQLPENIMRMRMIESMAPLHRYLDEELGFAECLTPEFNRFYDAEGNPTLTFLIAYRFSFNTLSLWWLSKLLLKISILGAGVYSFIHYNIWEWLQHLI